MSDESIRTGNVSSTPEGGPANEGASLSEPGAGQVYATPEAAPLGDDVALTPPSWHEHMDGPVLGMEDAEPAAQPAAAREEPRGTDGDAEPHTWPSYLSLIHI